ncbi:hypothetical protein FOZ61_007975 [Perkinsus olseni]|uniref:subtilisin n=1 Tax=Perkinsus olseni TaxID=32597 RepID=A0A7J6L6T6_PEROL|nr:hypothetical protein FOZ61_007975 [Perkinsus olseni]
MRISSAFAIASQVGAGAPPRDTIVSLKSGDGAVDIRKLPKMLEDIGGTPDEKFASFLETAEITSLNYVHSHVVQTSPSTIDSDALCYFVATASHKLSLRYQCPEEGYGKAYGLDEDLHVNDYDAGRQKHLKWMEMGEVWKLAATKFVRKPKVAVMDSGINFAIPDFDPLFEDHQKQSGGYLQGGWNFFTNSPILTHKYNHGTQVCKILAAKSNNTFGIAGVAPEVSLVPLQVVDDNGVAPLSKLMAAFNMAIDVKVDIATEAIEYNLTTAQRGLLWEALRTVQQNGILVVSAAGNSHEDASAILPSGFGGPLGICVTSLMDKKSSNVLSIFSNFGQTVDLATYGVRVFSGRKGDVRGGRPRTLTGTSASTAIAAGIAAIMVSMDVEPSMVKSLMLARYDPVTSKYPIRFPQKIRGGAINALKTVKYTIRWLSSRSRGLRGNDRLATISPPLV